MKIQRVPVGQLNPAPYNPRIDLKPGDVQYEQLARSLDEFGCVEPLVWNARTGHLVGGHQRFKLLLARGDTHVQVSVVDLPLPKEKALNLALNKITGSWDHLRLAELLDELIKTPELDLAITGFELPEAQSLISQMLAGAGSDSARSEDFDLEAELARAGSGPAITKPGDLIVLGKDPRLQHRLLCGDSTDPGAVAKLMGKDRAVIMATDPPYLVDYTGTNHPGAKHPAKRKPGSRAGRSKNKDWSATYGVNWDDADAHSDLYPRFIELAVSAALEPSAAVYIWHASRRQAMLESAMTAAGLLVHCQIIWAKNRPVLTRTWYAWQHEPCLMGWLQGHKPPKRSDKVLSTLWNIDTLPNGPDRPEHPTPKPLELFEIPLLQHTRAGEIGYEPFAGSGTQVIAAQRLGRRCLAMEISPVYCDLIVRRFIAFAGESAVDPAIARKYRTHGKAPAGRTALQGAVA